MFSDLVLPCLCLGARRGFHYCLLAWSQGTELKGEDLRSDTEAMQKRCRSKITRCITRCLKEFRKASSTLQCKNQLRGPKVVFLVILCIVNICELNKLGVPLSGVPSGFSLYPLYMSTTGVICKLPSKAVRTLA